ncbi:MAG TPA: Flp family type IVb pilin [Galbitalea sp.]
MSQRKRASSGQRARRLRVRFTNRDETGASLVEYALLLALIAVVAIGALVFLGHTVSNTLNNVGNDIAIGNPGGGGGGGGGGGPTFTDGGGGGTVTDTVALGQAGTFAFTTTGGTAPVTYSISGQPTGVTIAPTTGVLTIAAGTNSGTYSIIATATDTNSKTGTQTLTLKVSGPTADVANVTIPASTCQYFGGLGNCSSASWLDGLYIWSPSGSGSWNLIVSGTAGTGQMQDSTAYGHGTGGGGSWTCSQHTGNFPNQYCTQLQTNDNSFSHPGNYDLAS